MTSVEVGEPGGPCDRRAFEVQQDVRNLLQAETFHIRETKIARAMCGLLGTKKYLYTYLPRTPSFRYLFPLSNSVDWKKKNMLNLIWSNHKGEKT